MKEYRTDSCWLVNDDCLEAMKLIPDGKVDLILADLPYGTTACAWDSVIPLEPLWAQFKRVVKDAGAVVLTASQPFTSALVMSNPSWFRCEWVWDKVHAANFPNAKKQPLKTHESILVFGVRQTTYNPQKTQGKPNHNQNMDREFSSDSRVLSKRAPCDLSGMKYPKTIQTFPKHSSSVGLHPTQKPVDLMRYLVRTYSNPGEVVLDCTMGSGTTGVAALTEGRKFVGVEREERYFDIAERRIRESQTIAERREA